MLSVRCLITDGTYPRAQASWMAHLAHWLEAGVELVQIRERDLPVRELAALTRNVLALPNPRGTKILVNDRADVALACGAHGVHLRDGSVSPELFARPGFIVTVSCHSPGDAHRIRGADYALLAPIFKPISKNDDRAPLGTNAIAEFCRHSSVPVLALGGIDRRNEQACLGAGAAGIAGIGYFAL